MPNFSYKDSCQSRIKVIFAPGCYGHFLAQCIYTFSDLNTCGYTFSLGAGGDSHWSRHACWFGPTVYCEHRDVYREGSSDHTVVIVPDPQHALDYFVANYIKTHRANWVGYMQKHYQGCQMLLEPWGTFSSWDQVPRWLQREFMSFNIEAEMSASYDVNSYLALRSTYPMKTNDMFGTMSSWFGRMLESLELTQTQSDAEIDKIHSQFIQQQSWHNLQNRCIRWCEQVLCGIESRIKVLNVVQEAYIQSWFRKAGYEIKCQDLETLPTCSLQMKQFLYESSKDYC